MGTKGKHWRSGPRFFTGTRYTHPGLTEKQLTVIAMLGFGLTMGEIAAAEQVSMKSIEARRSLFCRKLQLHCMADIVKTAVGFGLISL